MELRWYAPKETDTQTPHDRHEVFVVVAGLSWPGCRGRVVVAGRGWFSRGEQRVAFRAGDALFVAAGQPPRFEIFTPDLALWVIFYRPVGGEAV